MQRDGPAFVLQRPASGIVILVLKHQNDPDVL